MTLTEKIRKKKSKSGFTLVELVIVIAILAILASIAIPVITTSMNSAKISVLDSDRATVEMLLKEAINTSKVGLAVLYNNKTTSAATVKDVLIANHIDLDVMDVHKIGGIDYAIYWEGTGTVLKEGTSLTAYNIDTPIANLG